jgi:hypothetical protein
MDVSSPPIPWYTVNRGKCADSGEKRNFICCQEGNPGCPVHIAVTIWLSYHGFSKLAYVVERRANDEISKTRPNSYLDVPILVHSRLIMIRNIIIIIIIIYLSWCWATCWPVPVSRIQMSLLRYAIISSASWGIAFHNTWYSISGHSIYMLYPVSLVFQ